MPNFKIILAASSIAVAAAAGAQAASMSDVQYMAAERCEALVGSPALGKGDTHALQALIRQQERGRSAVAIELGQQAHDDAARQARIAGGYEKSKLMAERDGACRAMVSGDTFASAR
jgi:hypothetical protein